MYAASLLYVLLFISIQEVYLQEDDYDYEDEEYGESPSFNCSTTETIRGGHVTYSQGGLEGSVLTYHCGPGHYPFPVTQRLCGAEGEWSTMRLANGRRVSDATCKEVLCPAQLQLDHGNFWPRDQWFHPGDAQSFSCLEGFTLSGSDQRNCTLSGAWTGTTPVCDNLADDCKDPGVPPGAQRSAGRFRTGEKVHYQCQTGLQLLGSAERVCLENREWSGSAPRCQAPYAFDSPSAVAEAMAGSLSGVMDVLSPQFKKKASIGFGRTIRVSDNSRMNIFILLDASGSISKKEFENSREAARHLIRKLDSYEVDMKFHVTSFASEAKDIVVLTDTFASTNAERVIQRLMNFDHNSHGKKMGTNLNAALQNVRKMIAFFKENSKNNHFNETQNVIIITTDGYTNTGTNPRYAVAQIRALLGYISTSQDHTQESLLDIYVFGVGSEVNREELNAIASHKRDEKHIFILREYKTLGQVFNSMISDKSVTKCGVAQEDVSENMDATAYTRPWHVDVSVSLTTSETCLGSIVSQNWVLTAAHCFDTRRTQGVPQQVEVIYGEGEGRVLATKVIMHPMYNSGGLKYRNVSQFYDYDIALVQLNKSIPLSLRARPICLPCTISASRAMRTINSTCEQHKNELLPHQETAAFFIHKNKRKQTHIHTGTQRPGCVEKVKETLRGLTNGQTTNVTVEEYVPDRFFCSGGSTLQQDSITCKGDSGGSLFLQKRMRYFQVGVVSWGTKDVCDKTKPEMRGYSSDRPPPDARDFHISLFSLVPWLKQHLGQEIEFLP